MNKQIVVIGAGNPCRGDDAVGGEFSRRLKRRSPADVTIVEMDGDPTGLMEAWADADVAFVVDAVYSDAAAGRIFRFEAHDGPIPAEAFRLSTHAFGVAEVIELARNLDRLPPRLVVYGIRGDRFEHEDELSPQVDDACDAVVLCVLEEIRELRADV
jgi:hydrogenase maturation protease